MLPVAASLSAPDPGLPGYQRLSGNQLRRHARRIAGLLFTGVLIAGTALSAQAGATITPDSGASGGGTIVSGTAAVPEFVQTSASVTHTSAVAADGSAWTWGEHWYGILGDGTGDSRNAPVQVVAKWPAGVTIKSVSAGYHHSMALASDGSVWAWGVNGAGQLGDGTNIDSSVPVHVTASWPAGVTIESISAGTGHSLAVASDGSLWAWGFNPRGQLGEGTADSRNEPVRVVESWPAGVTIQSASAGFNHSEAVDSDGSVWAWGDNDYNQLGDGTTTSSPTPVRVVPTWPSGVRIESVSTGTFHSVALASDGSGWAWGENIFGKLGDGTTTDSSVPVPIVANWPTGVTLASVSAGTDHSAAVASDGSLWVWGSNGSGQLGDGSTIDRSAPVQAVANWPAGATIKNVSAGGYHSAAVASDGSLWTWGYNGTGLLGDGTFSDRLSAGAVMTSLTVTGVTFGSLPGAHLTAVAGAGTFTATTPAQGAGSVDVTISTRYINDSPGPTFKLPGGFTYTPTPVVTPTAPPTRAPEPTGSAAIPEFVQTSAGYFHSLALASDGSVWAWGYNGDGQLGDGTTSMQNVPVQVVRTWPSDVTIESVTAGNYHSVALASDGTIWTWGSNSRGQLGDGTTNGSAVPVQVTASWPAAVTIESVDAGVEHSVAVTSDGSVWAWGDNTLGQLGDGTTSNSSVPVQVAANWPFGVTIKSASAGFMHSLAVTTDGTVWAWGVSDYGQLGDGTTSDDPVPGPVQVVASWPTGVTIESVSAGDSHSAAVASDGSVWAWGRNEAGKLGDGTSTNRSAPVRVVASWPGAVTIKSVSAGGSHSAALATDGSVWTWGYNGFGTLGDGTGTDSPVPVRVLPNWPAGVTINSISAGGTHSLAVASDGSTWAWGFNQWGQLGDGNNTTRNSPVAVTGFTQTPTATPSPPPATSTPTTPPTTMPTPSATTRAPTTSPTATRAPAASPTPAPTGTMEPTPSATPSSTPVVTLAVGEVVQGGWVELTASGFTPGEEVDLALHSEAVQLGSTISDQTGAFAARVQVPATTPVGAHTLTATGLTSGAVATAGLRVTESNITAADPVQDDADLAWTGASATVLTGAGILTLLVGAGIVSTRRRKSMYTHM